MLMSAATVNSIIKHRGKDAFPSSVVLEAAKFSKPGVLRVLEQHNFDLTVADNQGCSILHLAARNDQLETVEYLFTVGFPVNATDKFGQTTLHEAVMYCNPKVVDVLLQNGAQVNAQDKSGDAPIHVLIKYPQEGFCYMKSSSSGAPKYLKQ